MQLQCRVGGDAMMYQATYLAAISFKHSRVNLLGGADCVKHHVFMVSFDPWATRETSSVLAPDPWLMFGCQVLLLMN